jgi:hypothetical protein
VQTLLPRAYATTLRAEAGAVGVVEGPGAIGTIKAPLGTVITAANASASTTADAALTQVMPSATARCLVKRGFA